MARPTNNATVYKIRYETDAGDSRVEYRSLAEEADKLAFRKYREGKLRYYGVYQLETWYFNDETGYDGLKQEEELDEGQQG